MSYLLASFRRVVTLRRVSLTAAAVPAVCAPLVPRIASAQSGGAPGAGTRKVLITAFRGDLDAGHAIATELVGRIASSFPVRTLVPVSARDIETTLEGGYRSDSALNPNDLKELAKLVHADEVIDGTIATSGSGYRVTARMFLPRDIALSQPLVTDASVKDLRDAATAIIGEYARARTQLPSEQACETAIRANQNAAAIAAAREGIRNYPRAVLVRLCMASAYANMKLGADSTQPWKDSVIAITRDILKLDKTNRIAYQLQYDVYKATLDTAAADSNYFFRQISDLQADSSFAKAAELAAIGVAKFPRSTPLLLLKAQNERRAGQLAAAKASLQRALEIDPKVSGATYLLASISAEMGNANDAMKYAKADAAAAPANKARAAAVLLQLGNAQFRVASASKTAEDYRKAIPSLQASDEISPSANAKFLLGVSAFRAIAASMDALRASKSCKAFRQASDLLSIVNNNMPAGGFVDVNTMKQIMESAVQYAPFFEGSIKMYCQ